MGFTNVFSGQPVATADLTYQAVTLSANTTFNWPNGYNTGSNVVAGINDVTPSSAGLTWQMPSAELVSPGTEAVFNNVGAYSFQVTDAAGNLLMTVPAGQVWLIYLRTNATLAGQWRILQMGAGTSIAQAGPLAGAGLIASNGVLIESMPSQSISSNYVTGAADRAIAFLWTAGSGTFTIPAVSNLVSPAGWFVGVKNTGSGTLTLQPTGCNIDGAASINLNPNDFCFIITDGTNLWTIGRGQSATFSFSLLSINIAGQTSYTLSSNQLNQIAYKFTGALTANCTVIVPTTVQQYWVDNETTGGFNIIVQTASGTGVSVQPGQRLICYCDGTNIVNGDTGGISTPISVAQGGTGSTSASGALTNLGGTSIGTQVFTAASAANAQSALGVPSTDTAMAEAIAMGLL